MTTLAVDGNASLRLRELLGRLDLHEGFGGVVASLTAGHAATLDGVWGAACSLIAARLAEHAPATLLLVCPELSWVDRLMDDLALFTSVVGQRFAAWEAPAARQALRDEVLGDRVRLLKRLSGAEPPRILVAAIQGLMQPVPDREALHRHTRRLHVGGVLSLADLAGWLAASGLHHTTAVELPGEFSVRGGILDVFAPDWDAPARIELFDDEIESIRQFDVATQRSLARLDAVEITLVDAASAGRAHLADYLPDRSWVVLVEPGEMEEQATRYLERAESPELLHGTAEVVRSLTRFPSVTAWAVAPGSFEATCHLRIESVERLSGQLGRVRDELDEAGAGQEVFVVCPTEAESQRLGELFCETKASRQGRLYFPIGTLSKGFRLVPERTVLLSSAELFHREDLVRPTQRRLGRVIDSFLDLRQGDLVVHVAHGIARYRGLKLLEKGQQREEHLELEFDGGTRLYVPSSKIGLVQKYVGGSKSRPTLARLGGQSWVKQKAKVQQAVTDLAADMLELQAARASRPGIGFPPDTEWQREFDASFPYQETPDQLVAIDAIKSDMTRSRPMDRLLCGDVGYGKTELAMRAAFKAVDAGFQVAILVPTTILAEQHYRTFSARMAEFPFQIASLSRFLTRGKQNDVIKRLATGGVDIIIGTHRLAQRDVRFENLGLVIIDEEQRFGVEVKEHLKAIRSTVDVLTMTATPIPRTLHLSLLGVRDISNLETPPEDRLAVETRVTRFNAELIRNAVVRELTRG
ncbi:MAG: CarD family transcriptional regulator, partial [Patescibacteria group bacterium]|nr:CarD family transcriptional regulator [Patescibacteria group bacterium]